MSYDIENTNVLYEHITIKLHKMKKIVSLLIIIPFFSFAQTDSIVNYTDINGMKQGYWVKKDMNGQKIYEGYFKNNIPYGEMKRYHGNGVLKALMVFDKTNQSKVNVTYFDDTGELSAKGYFYDKQRDSLWQYFGAGAILVGEEHYIKGLRTGVSKSSTRAEKSLKRFGIKTIN